MSQWSLVCLVAIGGALGALARYALVIGTTAMVRTSFPTGTLLVNSIGCFCVGLAAAKLESKTLSTVATACLQQGFVVGFLGALTTFSAFGLDTWRLQSDRQFLLAALNVVANLIVGLALVWCGLRLGRSWW